MDLDLSVNLEALAFLYLTCGHTTDGELTAAEMRQIGANLVHWAPARDKDAIGVILRRAADEYKGLDGDDARIARARDYATRLAASYEAPELKKILAGLTVVARADGHTSDSEKGFVLEIARAFGIV